MTEENEKILNGHLYCKAMLKMMIDDVPWYQFFTKKMLAKMLRHVDDVICRLMILNMTNQIVSDPDQQNIICLDDFRK